jgi:hypothetical protein
MDEHRTMNLIASSSHHVEEQLNQVANKLVSEYESVDEATVRRYVQDERAQFSGAKVQVFVPILVERAVRNKLARAG